MKFKLGDLVYVYSHTVPQFCGNMIKIDFITNYGYYYHDEYCTFSFTEEELILLRS